MSTSTNSRYYIGGGNIAGIIGVSPFRTPLDEYHTIIGDSPELSAANEAFFKRRKALEPFVAAVLSERGYHVLDQNRRLQDRDYPFMKAELDAETILGANFLRNAEFKSVNPFAAGTWGEDGDPEGAPTYVTAQAQWGLGVSDRTNCDIVAAIGFDDSRLYPIVAAKDVIDRMRFLAVDFWEQYVLARRPPAPRNVEDILNWVTPDPNKTIEATDLDGLAETVAEFVAARKNVKDSEAELEKLKTRIQLVMADATALTLRGKPAVTWKRNKDSEVTDWRGLALALSPDTNDIKRFTSPKTGNRVFRVVESK